jgi:hypothetical protein
MMLCLLLVLNVWADEQHAVVVSPKKEDIELSKREIKKFFTRQKVTWVNEERVTIVLPLIESPAMAWLSRNILGLPPDVYYRYLMEKAYRAGEDPPAFVESPTLTEGELVLTVMKLEDHTGESYSVVRIR